MTQLERLTMEADNAELDYEQAIDASEQAQRKARAAEVKLSQARTALREYIKEFGAIEAARCDR